MLTLSNFTIYNILIKTRTNGNQCCSLMKTLNLVIKALLLCLTPEDMVVKFASFVIFICDVNYY